MLCWTEAADNSPEVDCGTLRAADMTEDVTSQREDAVAATESVCDVTPVDDVTRADDVTQEVVSHSSPVDTCTLSPAPAVETESTGRSPRPKKFIDRRTETLISACATVSAADADVTRDVINEPVTSPVPRSPKYRDRQFDVSSPRDRRQLGVVKDARPHRSTLTSVPTITTTTTTATLVNVLRSPVSLVVLRSDRPQQDEMAAAAAARSPIVSPSAESRLTVTLAESTTCQQSQRNCRLITHTGVSTKPFRNVVGSGSDNDDYDDADKSAAVDLQSAAVASHPARPRSASSSDVETSKSQRTATSSVCVLARLSPVTVQPSSGPGRRTTSSHRRVPVTADTTSTSLVISRRTVIDLVSPPPLLPQCVVTELTLPVSPVKRTSSFTVPSPSRRSPSLGEVGAGEAAAVKTPAVTQGGAASVMSALDNAMAMLTSVVSENSHQPAHVAASSAPLDVIVTQPGKSPAHHYFNTGTIRRSKSSSKWDLLVYFHLLLLITTNNLLCRKLDHKKFELMLTRRAKAYSIPGSVV